MRFGWMNAFAAQHNQVLIDDYRFYINGLDPGYFIRHDFCNLIRSRSRFLVGPANDILDLVQFLGKMKVAGTSAVGGSKMGNHPQFRSYSSGYPALQVSERASDHSIHQGSVRQQVIYMPPPDRTGTKQHSFVTFYPLQATWTPGRTCIGVVAFNKLNNAEGPDFYLLSPIKQKH